MGEQDVLRRCLQGEEVSLDMTGVRDRVLRIGRVGVAVRDGEHGAADLCGRWLIGKTTKAWFLCDRLTTNTPSPTQSQSTSFMVTGGRGFVCPCKAPWGSHLGVDV